MTDSQEYLKSGIKKWIVVEKLVLLKTDTDEQSITVFINDRRWYNLEYGKHQIGCHNRYSGLLYWKL